MKFGSNPTVGSGSKNYLKLKDKERVICILRGEPQEYYATWDGTKFQECDENSPKAGFRFRVNAVIQENGVYVAKIFEQGATIYNILKELNDEYELEKTFLIITRNGTGTDTTYHIIPSQKTKWDPKTGKQIEAVQLHSLGAQKTETTAGDDDDPDSEIPF